MATQRRVLLYVVRRNLRVSDQPIFHHLASTTDHGFSHFLPVYVFPAQQINVSGFLKDGSVNPYPDPRSRLGRYPRCGPHRAKFLAECVWDLQKSLEALGSGLLIRVGRVGDVVRSLTEGLTTKDRKVAAIWMTSHEGAEENHDERAVAMVCKDFGVEFKLWEDEKYLIDEILASLPEDIPSQTAPFTIPTSAEELIEALTKPVKNFLPVIPDFPQNAVSAYPFRGGEAAAQARLRQFVQSGQIANYRATRGGLATVDSSTKLSAYLAQGCITSRQVHHFLLGYEDGTDDTLKDVTGYGGAQNEGTEAVRTGLLWRDYMRLCHRKFKDKFFRLEGFRGDGRGSGEGEWGKQEKPKWKSPVQELASTDQDPDPRRVAVILERFISGTTGMGLIDASQRELMHTGYTSNRARQNVACFLAKHLGIDWRYGAEWYEMLLVDYDVSSGWANWQYVAGVGNDPRSGVRIFNPVKQAVEYDKDGQYVRSWVPEVSKLEMINSVFQAWTASEEDIRTAGLEGSVMVTDPVKRIEFSVDGKPRARKRGNEARGQRWGRKGSRAGNLKNLATEEAVETSSPLVEKKDGEPGSSPEPSMAVTTETREARVPR
ncbi:putative cryptochrome DASH, mitochondrial [Madurella mycetomatis]|uniref:Cryptochrome DASH n=1 Tax=Madurella mycetomatis TaxID=100816 RepID=A0A175W871_9PEZI|nr:putative cryptochrome DASH, mitochondrial [Madurella mycetomatis]